uniref:Gastrula zinc finger protein xFG20-1 n=1 Tax=Culex pipiens TaxID=7175 RepID=A0A8D8JZQ7_CULPI
MEETGDLQLCRVCAENCRDRPYVSLAEVHGEKSYLEMVAFCGQIEISNETDLPKIICTVCCVQLTETYRFCMKCRSAEQTIRLKCSQNKETEDELPDKIVEELIELPDLQQTTAKDCNEILVDLMTPGEDELFDEIIEENHFSDGDSFGDEVEVGNLEEEVALQELPIFDGEPMLIAEDGLGVILTASEQNVEMLDDEQSQERTYHTMVSVFDQYNNETQSNEPTNVDPVLSDPIASEIEQFNFLEVQEDDSTEESEDAPIDQTETVARKQPVGRKRSGNVLPPKAMIVEQADHGDYDVIHYSGVACCGCDQYFKNQEGLLEHCQIVHQLDEVPSDFFCPHCYKSFRGPVLLEKHMHVWASPEIFSCKLCKYNCREESVMERHLESSVIHDKPMPALDKVGQVFDKLPIKGLMCCECYHQFPKDDELQKHYVEIHHPERPKTEADAELDTGHYFCQDCHQIFRNKHKYDLHVKNAKMDFLFCCKHEFCTYKTPNVNFAKFHMRSKDHESLANEQSTSETVDEYKQRRCCFRKCLDVFDSKKALMEHVDQVHRSKQLENEMRRKKSTNVCSICMCNFGTRRALKQHLQPKVKGFICEICQESHVSAFHLKTHFKKVHSSGLRSRDYKCDECPCTFVNAEYLRKHKLKGHDKEHVCSICERKFKNKEGLWTHWRIHNKQTKHECESCKKAGKRYSFRDVKTLNRHFKISEAHNGNRKFACAVEGCTSAYAHKPDLKRHEMTVHKGILPCRCKFCDKGFVRERDLRLHERVHTGAKLYNCKRCNAGFNVYHKYKLHCKEKHGFTVMIDSRPKGGS